MRKKAFGLGFYFSLVVLIIMLCSAVIISPLIYMALQRGFFIGADYLFFFLAAETASIIVSTIVSVVIGKKILKPIRALGDAAKKVSEGDFSVRVDEEYRVDELSDMARSFNVMVSELSNKETLRSDFIANLSHEFKTPLAAIEGYSILLRDADLSEEERYEYEKKIIEATRRLNKISANILKISQLEGTEIISDKKIYRLDEQLRQAILMLEGRWSEKELELDIELEDTEIYANEELLMQAFVNIISNAVKFTSHGGKISVTLTHDEKNAHITVSDTGIGMDKETLHRIYDKFYQSDTSHKCEGNGLGLAIAHRIIALSQGEIRAESELGKGSKFEIILPM